MRRPIIGITTSACADGQLTVRDSYIQAITAHGGLPCPLCTDTDSIALKISVTRWTVCSSAAAAI